MAKLNTSQPACMEKIKLGRQSLSFHWITMYGSMLNCFTNPALSFVLIVLYTLNQIIINQKCHKANDEKDTRITHDFHAVVLAFLAMFVVAHCFKFLSNPKI